MSPPDLVHGSGDPESLDCFCSECRHIRAHPEGEYCALFSFQAEPIDTQAIMGEPVSDGIVFCETARTKGPCHRGAFGFEPI